MRDERGEVLPKAVGQEQRGTVWSQDLGDLMDETLGQGQGALTDINGQDELADRVHRHPHPVGRARQALDRLGLGDLTLFDGAE